MSELYYQGVDLFPDSPVLQATKAGWRPGNEANQGVGRIVNPRNSAHE